MVKVESESSSGRDDPFVQLLSNYMSSKAANPRLSSVKAKVSRKESRIVGHNCIYVDVMCISMICKHVDIIFF